MHTYYVLLRAETSVLCPANTFQSHCGTCRNVTCCFRALFRDALAGWWMLSMFKISFSNSVWNLSGNFSVFHLAVFSWYLTKSLLYPLYCTIYIDVGTDLGRNFYAWKEKFWVIYSSLIHSLILSSSLNKLVPLETEITFII